MRALKLFNGCFIHVTNACGYEAECNLHTHTVPSERVIVNKERSSGSYRLSSYFAAKMLSELPLNIFLPSIYIIVVYWAAGLNPSAAAFFGTWFFMILNALTTQASGGEEGGAVTYVMHALHTVLVVVRWSVDWHHGT